MLPEEFHQAQLYWPLVKVVSADLGMPATLILAIMWRESAFGLALTPKGPTGTGDHGHGRGLMQIDDRAHGVWVASNNWQDPETNIRYGTKVLKEAHDILARKGFHGDLLWTCALAAYNAGVGAVIRAVQAGKEPDSVTTGRNYSKWTTEHVQQLLSLGFN